MIQTVDRSAAVLLVVAFICIASVGMTAATIDSVNPIGGSENDQVFDPPSPRDAVDVGEEAGGATGDGQGSGSMGSSYASVTTCVPFLNSTLGLLTVLASVLGISLFIYKRYNAALSLFAGWTILPPTMLGYFLTTDCGTSGGSLLGGGAAGGLSAPGRGPISVGQIPTWVMALFAVAIGAGAVALLYRSSGADEVVQLEEETTTDDVELDQFAAAAGRAADRIEEHNQDVDNAVYRAWVEMTGFLDVDSPETSSAGEFAEAAIEAGMSRDDVQELTTLFNEVRYGDRDVQSREDQSVAVLRNIETQYGATSDATQTDEGTNHDDTDESTPENETGDDT